jgi:hypothetical protein
MPSVGVTGEVVATASTATTFGGVSGAWTAGPVTETAYPKLTVGGATVIYEATCTFTFSGGPPPTTSASVVTLRASATPLQGGLSNVLRDGDAKVDTNGNRLEVRVSRQPKLNS